MSTQNEPDMSRTRPRLHVLVNATGDTVNTDEPFEKEFRMRWHFVGDGTGKRESQAL